MDVYRDIRLLFVALRDRLIDPDRLASAAADWSPPTGLIAHLAGRGVISPETLEHLQAARLDEPAAVHDGDPSLRPTPRVAGDGEATTDHPGSAGDTPAGSERDGFSIPALAGRYSILRLHQSGGLGQVWVARDLAVGRDVALKTLRPERVSGETARSRFIREARVTGQLEHPSIVPLYDLADNGADPFYVMRFISGRTLAEAAADYHKRRAAGTTGPLDLNTLLDAFINVCRAVAFAHSRNVLHRDLKGQNVVVGEYGETFLLDWGLAKSVGEVDESAPTLVAREDGVSDLTETGAAVGTPAYMAPEVAAGRPATKASDVYGLGAILHAVLAGRPPYSGSTAAEVLQKVAMSEPAAVADSNPSAPPALVAVCRRAMARDPAGRYSSAEEVATEVRRWLADEPVHAYREPFPARAARWARRRKTAVVAAGVLLATAAVASSTAAGLLWREEQKTATAKERAEKNASLARGVSAEALALVRTVDPVLAATHQLHTYRKGVVFSAAQVFTEHLDVVPSDPSIRSQAVSVFRYKGFVERLEGADRQAESDYQNAIGLLEGLVEQFPEDSNYREQLAEALRELAVLRTRLGPQLRADELYRRVLSTLEPLQVQSRERSQVRRIRAITLVNRAVTLLLLGEKQASLSAAREAVGLFEGLALLPSDERHPFDPLHHARALMYVAVGEREEGRLDAARVTHAAAVKIYGPLLKSTPFGMNRADIDWTLAACRLERARTWAKSQDLRAWPELDAAVEGYRLLATGYPWVVGYASGQADALNVRGELRARASRPGASADYEQAKAVAERLVERFPEVQEYRSLLGRAYKGLADTAQDGRTRDEYLARAGIHFEAAVDADPDSVINRLGLDEVRSIRR